MDNIDIDIVIENAARGGLTDYAENIAHLHGRSVPHLFIGARVEEEVLLARQQQAEESETEGYDRGRDDADQTNDLIFDRHMRALLGAEVVIVAALQAYARAHPNPSSVFKVDNALLAFRGVLDDLADSTHLRDQLRDE